MKAIRIHEFGGPSALVYEDVAKPEPAADELLVKVISAGINPVDWKVEEGSFEKVVAHTLPLIPGWDFAGIVESVGSEVTKFKAGDEVLAVGNVARDGAYAEFVLISEKVAVLKPPSIDFITAGGIALTATTAWHAVYTQANLVNGQTILVHAGGGSVGAFAIQFAKVTGAKVIATASADDLMYVKEIGADIVVDYKNEKFEDVAKDVDVVLDTIGGETQARSWKTVRDGGVLVSVVGLTTDPGDARARGVKAKAFSSQPDGAILKQIVGLFDSGKVKARVDSVYPLSEARLAQEHASTGHPRGKVILEISNLAK